MPETKTKRAVVCQRCGAVYPPDYYEQWGRKYGRGLGPDPVCEAMRSKYDRPFNINPQHPEKAMFPLQVCKGVMVNQDVPADTESFILAINDPGYKIRSDIMRNRQRAKIPALDSHLRTAEKALASQKQVVGW